MPGSVGRPPRKPSAFAVNMRIKLGIDKLQTDFTFEVFCRVGPYVTVNGALGHINKIGVYLSGGIDSTALLCLLLTELIDTDMLGKVQIICFTVEKDSESTYYAGRLLQKVKDHFNVSIIHVTDIPNDNSTGNIGASTIRFIKAYASNMVTYMGSNRMAPDDVRPFAQQLNIDYGYEVNTPDFSSPFLFLHKPQILDILYQLGCDDLIQYTHSCAMQKIGACGQCYACAERKWGFSALLKTDPGTLLP